MAERVPQKDDLFNTYLNTTTAYLLDEPGGPGTGENWERLGLLEDEKDQWVTYKDDWNEIYETYTTNQNNGISDKTVTANKNTAKENFIDWVIDPDMNKLNRIAASPNITQQDREVFHIKKRDDNRTTHTAPIGEDIFFDLKALGGGDVRVRARYDSDATRASIPADAKAVELCYLIGTEAPETVAECNEDYTSTKALFTFNVGAENATKRMYCFARWVDTTNPNRAGSWGDMVTIVIS